ncbi:MAG: hypothetical protein JSW73_02805 [Candidatus Woesearchaeota archaeon]|nr:MAG: hypothetical protein JSW73_02805 [Candidatus Woesearchaeota archaeon]
MIKIKESEVDTKELAYIGIIAVLLVVLVILSATVSYLSTVPAGRFSTIGSSINTHTVCFNGECVIVTGIGNDECYTHADCR